MKPRKKRFDMFRFQIVPLDRYAQQGDLFGKYASVSELLENKNKIFETVFDRLEYLEIKNTIITARLVAKEDDTILIQIAPRRTVVVEDKQFEKHTITNWPSFYIYVNNNPEIQTIIIEERKEAFQSTNSVALSLQRAFNSFLIVENLKIYIEPMFEKKDFWEIIEKNKSNIRQVKFELVTPNMANISNVLSDEIKEFSKITNSQRTVMAIEAAEESSLKLDKDNKQVKALVGYASDGGGNIAIRFRGMHRLFNISKKVKTLEIEEVEVVGANPQQIIDVLNGLIS